MRVFITKIFYLSCLTLIVLGMIVAIAWLFDSEPKNLWKTFKVVSNICMIMFGVNLLFGGKER